MSESALHSPPSEARRKQASLDFLLFEIFSCFADSFPNSETLCSPHWSVVNGSFPIRTPTDLAATALDRTHKFMTWLPGAYIKQSES